MPRTAHILLSFFFFERMSSEPTAHDFLGLVVCKSQNRLVISVFESVKLEKTATAEPIQ
jgi:hypothetical protein